MHTLKGDIFDIIVKIRLLSLSRFLTEARIEQCEVGAWLVPWVVAGSMHLSKENQEWRVLLTLHLSHSMRQTDTKHVLTSAPLQAGCSVLDEQCMFVWSMSSRKTRPSLGFEVPTTLPGDLCRPNASVNHRVPIVSSTTVCRIHGPNM